MIERKLTPEEINQLFDFCQKRNVKEYEIQAELVDHLASSIEIQLEQNASLSFFEALNIAYNDFGTNGFKEIVKIKRRMFRHKYNRLFLSYLATFFQLPRIILTLALTISLYSVFCYFDESQSIFEFIGVLAMLLNLIYSIVIHPPYQEKGKASFMLIYYFNRIRTNTVIILNGLFIAAMHSNQYFVVQKNAVLDFLISFFVVVIFITTYISMIYMPKILSQHFKEQFPDILYSVL
jgi:hypothetical protein